MDVVEDEGGVRGAVSSYQYFYRSESGRIKKDMMVVDGNLPAMQEVTAAVSLQWRSLSEAERDPFEQQARVDRARFQRDCAARDAEVMRRQAERRAQNAIGEDVGSRVRLSTAAATESTYRELDVPKRKRELNEEEQEDRDERRKAKLEQAEFIRKETAESKGTKAQQAEARLKYLLAQSDIFAHFGKSAGGGNDGKAAAKLPDLFSSTTTAAASSSSSSSISSSSSSSSSSIIISRRRSTKEDDNYDGDESLITRPSVIAQPSIITGGPMRQYQLEGLTWVIHMMENGINGILADEMGLGKTLQSISVIAYLYQYMNNKGPHLILVPKSTLSNWEKEFERWCPSVSLLRFHGNKDEREFMVQNDLKVGRSHDQRSWNVCLTTYEICNIEKGPLGKIAWQFLIIDEAHRLKNEASSLSKVVRALNTQHRLLLTGTPLQNNLHELWALLNFLLPDVFASSEQFDEWFNLDVEDTEAKQRIIGQLHKLLRPFMLRRLKVDVEKSLPPKTETILFIGMSVEQRALYKTILMRELPLITTDQTINSSKTQAGCTAILNVLMQLRKCCNHPYLFPGQEDRTLHPLGDHLYTTCGKMVLLHRLLTKLKARDHRVLIFSQMTRMLDILEDYMLSQGFKYCRIDGDTSYDAREDRITDFNREGSEKFCFLLSTRAGGLGINLQTADTVILYDSDWNPQADLQAQDRAHRIGQKKPVQVFRLVTDESVEVKVLERGQQKLKLDAMVVQQGRLADKERKMSKQELLESLRFGADKVFRTKESTITDADIDLILEEGRKRTEEMNEKLKKADKGDMYDFKLDGGFKAQEFEGKDYSLGVNRLPTEGDELASLAMLEAEMMGKREPKRVTTYLQMQSFLEHERPDPHDKSYMPKKPKLPRHMRLSRMEDFQFYNVARLEEIHAIERAAFDEKADRGEIQGERGIGSCPKGLQVLSASLLAEKEALHVKAFGEWNRVHHNTFLRASGRYGRREVEKIALVVGKPLEEVRRYHDIFWKEGIERFGRTVWDEKVKVVERGEKRASEIDKMQEATNDLVKSFADPWNDLTFRFTGSAGRVFNLDEDRTLLCLTQIHGHGAWEHIRSSIRSCERFSHNFFLLSCNDDAISRRCDVLMRAAEREYAAKQELRDRGMNRQEIDQLLQSSTSSRPMEDLAPHVPDSMVVASDDYVVPATILSALSPHSERLLQGVVGELDGLVDSILGSFKQFSENSTRDAMREALIRRREQEEASVREEISMGTAAQIPPGSFAKYVQQKLASQPEYAEMPLVDFKKIMIRQWDALGSHLKGTR